MSAIESLAVRGFLAACQMAEALFAEDGTIEPCVTMLHPSDAPNAVIPFLAEMPPPGEDRKKVWLMLRLASMAFDAQVLVHIAEVWLRLDDDAPPDAQPEEKVMVAALYREGGRVMQLTRWWAIERDEAGVRLGAAEDGEPSEASESYLTNCLPNPRPSAKARKAAKRDLERIVGAEKVRAARERVPTTPQQKETMH